MIIIQFLPHRLQNHGIRMSPNRHHVVGNLGSLLFTIAMREAPNLDVRHTGFPEFPMKTLTSHDAKDVFN